MSHFLEEYFHEDHFSDEETLSDKSIYHVLFLCTKPLTSDNEQMRQEVQDVLAAYKHSNKVQACFYQGSFLNESDRTACNASFAHAVCIVANPGHTPSQSIRADRQALVQAIFATAACSSVKHGYLRLQLNDPELLPQVPPKVSPVLCIHKLRGQLLAGGVLCPGLVPLLLNLLSSRSGDLASTATKGNNEGNPAFGSSNVGMRSTADVEDDTRTLYLNGLQ